MLFQLQLRGVNVSAATEPKWWFN